jgi:hypothetical protein
VRDKVALLLKSRPLITSEKNGAMHRVLVKIAKDGKQAWKAIKWQYCEKCGMILPDTDAN